MDLPFDTLLLAGGSSTRMGTDKALLPVGDGRLLWERQLELLRVLKPGKLFVSGPVRPGFPDDIIALPDSQPGLGPLAGLVEGLRMTQAPLLLVLAIDLPAMTSGYLTSLLARCQDGRGCVAQRDGWFEPLAAIYPRHGLSLAEKALESDDRSLQSLVAAMSLSNLISVQQVDQAHLFANWNEGDSPAQR